jgi:hypothetical protein
MKIVLINYEGACLWALNTSDGIVIYDQWESLVDILTEEAFLEWIDGEFWLMDSEGKKWVFTEEHKDAKPSVREIINFLKIENKKFHEKQSINHIFQKMKLKNFDESMSDNTKLKVLNWVMTQLKSI